MSPTPNPLQLACLPERFSKGNVRMRLIVGLSGGADSVALLLWLMEQGASLVAAHCNFSLRGEESDADEAFVRELCKRLGVELYVKRFDTLAEAELHKESMEMAARTLRYDFFEELRKAHGAEAIAVAHHQDDNAETLLLNLARGTGLSGLRGMEMENKRFIVRPFLNVSRRQIEQYLAQRGEAFVTDSTNKDTSLRRNFVRHELMPLMRHLNPSVGEALSRTMRFAAEAERLCNSVIDKEIARLETRGMGIRALPLEELRRCEHQLLLLHRWLGHCFPPAVVMRLATDMDLPAGALYEGYDHEATRSRDTLEFAPTIAPLPATTLPIGGKVSTRWGCIVLCYLTYDTTFDPSDCLTASLDATCIRGELTVRSVATGDRFTPYGLKGSKLVSDMLSERGYSRLRRKRTLVVTDEEGIVWLVGERIAARCAVTRQTETVVRLNLYTDLPSINTNA